MQVIISNLAKLVIRIKGSGYVIMILKSISCRIIKRSGVLWIITRGIHLISCFIRKGTMCRVEERS